MINVRETNEHVARLKKMSKHNGYKLTYSRQRNAPQLWNLLTWSNMSSIDKVVVGHNHRNSLNTLVKTCSVYLTKTWVNFCHSQKAVLNTSPSSHFVPCSLPFPKSHFKWLPIWHTEINLRDARNHRSQKSFNHCQYCNPLKAKLQ